MDIAGLIADLDQHLAEADAALGARLPRGRAPGRQPVHTVYVPADQFTTPDSSHDYGRAAQASVVERARRLPAT